MFDTELPALDDPMPEVSVIMPALNEERALPGTLDALVGQRGDFEVVVVDGGSTDRTRELAAAMLGARVLQAPRGRAPQMNAGAAVARGRWLLFLHADTRLPPGAIAAIQALPATVQHGGFRHRFSGAGAGLRLVSWLDNGRCRITGIVYGDQAPFVRRELFYRLGGYPNQAVMEDVAMGERLLAAGRPLILAAEAVTDPRKFLRHGVWRSLWRVSLIALLASLRLPIPRSARRFFDDVR